MRTCVSREFKVDSILCAKRFTRIIQCFQLIANPVYLLTHSKERGTPAAHGFKNQETAFRYNLDSP